MIKFDVVCNNKYRYLTCEKCNAFRKDVNVYSIDNDKIELCEECLKECEQILNSPYHLIRYISNIEYRLREVENRSSDHYDSGY